MVTQGGAPTLHTEIASEEPAVEIPLGAVSLGLIAETGDGAAAHGRQHSRRVPPAHGDLRQGGDATGAWDVHKHFRSAHRLGAGDEVRRVQAREAMVTRKTLPDEAFYFRRHMVHVCRQSHAVVHVCSP
eukprot:CAMPEP_0185454550 /NCGR_PEP_ID=MMETSP1365-20130426/73003_1 /TAXON_ID=38817 /ORGANISM="Gephyrocapsa oceanica, Strain RCC1303" /LENGTH=128 /DNA_ID=CAMNT_0028060873 /DNA_START=446 /DNA_END=828 /DNA_ORIENTATION=+